MSLHVKGSVLIKNTTRLESVCQELGLHIVVAEAAAYMRRRGDLTFKIEGFPLPFHLNSETGEFNYDMDMLDLKTFMYRDGKDERIVSFNKVLNLYMLRTLEAESGRSFSAFWNEDGTLDIKSEYGSGQLVRLNASQSGMAIEAEGFQGKGCENAVMHLADLLGTVEEKVITDEYYREDPTGGTVDVFASY